MTGTMAQRDSWSRWLHALASPWPWLGLFLMAVLLLLSLPVRMPIGPNYWDLAMHLDGSHRIALGQMPHRDFFTPVGGLGFLLFRGVEALWPQAHPLLVSQWCILLVTLPPIAWITRQVGMLHGRKIGLALLLPFLFFAAFPINGLELYPSPGFDAYGNYNRHVCLILYVLTSALWLLPQGRGRLAVTGFLLLVLFGIKITGFLVGAGLVLHGAMAGQFRWRELCVIILAVAAILVAVDAATSGAVTAYLADVASLVAINSGSLLSRFLTAASVEFDVLVGGAMLAMVLAIVEWRGSTTRVPVSMAAHARLLANSSAARVGVTLLGGVFFETQNTGSQEFIFLWPVLLTVLMAWWHRAHPARTAVLILVAVTVIPHNMKILHRAARAVASAPVQVPLDDVRLGPIARVSAKRDLMERADILLAHYATHRPAFAALAEQDQLPSAIIFSEIDFQLAWLKSVDQAVIALKKHEAETGRRYESLATLDFVDLFTKVLDRKAPLQMPLALDAFRTLLDLDGRVFKGLAETDGILVPSCPVMHTRRLIVERFAPALEGRALVELTPCWTLRPKSAP